MSSSTTAYASLNRPRVRSYDDITAVRWRRDWKDLPAMVLATLTLLTWISAAAYVTQQRKTLPLTYWKTSVHGLLGNGNYNTVIAVAGGIAGAIVCFGIAQAMKDVLRKEVLSEQGVTLSRYATLVKLANQAIEFRWHLSALLPFMLFATINLFGAATQAAFGTSIENYNLTLPFPMMRLSNNVEIVRQTMSSRVGVNSLLYLGELRDALQSAVAPFVPADQGRARIAIETVAQVMPYGGVALPCFLHVAALGLQAPVLANLTLSVDDVALIRGSYGSNWAYAPVEGFSTRSTCREQTIPITSTRLASGLVQYSFTLPDCSESSSGVYDGNLPIAFDAYACQRGSPNVYFIQLQPESATAGPAWSCYIDSVTSAVYQGVYSQQSNYAGYWGSASDPVAISFVGDIVTYSGFLFWNTFGLAGSSELNFGWFAAQAVQTDFSRVLEWATATITSMVAAKLADILDLGALEFKVPAYSTEPRVAHYQVQALKLHLSGPQLAWMILPLSLLVLILWLIAIKLFRNFRIGGRVDLTDPCAVLLIAGAGPEEPLWRGASTGEFADGNTRDFLRINYGADVGNRARLVLRGSTDMIAGRPALGENYK